MRILMPSIVDPRLCRGGAWAATRGLTRVIELGIPGAAIECVPLAERSGLRHRGRQIRCITEAVVSNSIPAKVRFASDDALLDRVLEHVDEEPDLILINGSDLLWLLPYLPASIPTVVIVHNIEHELYAAQLDSVSSRIPGIGQLLRRDLQALEKFEWSALRSVKGAIFLSDADRTTALQAAPGLSAIAVPPVFDYYPRPRRNNTSGPLRLGMFADFTWWPNRDALKWFLETVWPRVTGNIELRLFGYGSTSAARAADRVRTYGFVAEPADAFSECDLMIAPAVTGAGVKVKVAEALHNRVPVVASPLALRGLDRQASAAVRSCATSDEWVAFLSCDAARAFAGAKVADKIALRFAPAAAASSVAEFIDGVRSRYTHAAASSETRGTSRMSWRD